jgi:hypothetical protein
MAERNTRIIRLTGLGTALEDRIADLKEIRGITTTEAQKTEIDNLVYALESAKETCRKICQLWSRSYDVE